jgi:hypothetical protein
MTLAFIRLRPCVFLLAAVLLAVSPQIVAAQRPQSAPAPAAERQGRAVAVPPATFAADTQDANETRERLQQLLDKYPPTLGQVLKLDPSLLERPEYMAAYPALAAFVADHPEVVHNPAFFFANVRGPNWSQPNERRTPAYDLMANVLGGLAALSVFAVVTATLIWLIRTIIDYRRWNRLSKVQTEVHTKLLDRFTANDDLLAYIQTPPGRKFLESAPIPLHEEARSIGAPLSRILWSVQAGVVLSLLGLGLLFVSGRVNEEVAQGVFVIGTLVIALGLGFVASAGVAYGISRRMGLLERPAASAQEHA